MAPTRRRLLRTVAASVGTVAVAGCVGSDPTAGDGTGTTDRGTTDSGTPGRTTEFRTTEPPVRDTPSPTEGSRPRPTDGDPSETVRPSAEVSYDRQVTVENGTSAERTVRLTVEEPREEATDEAAVYHAETYTVDPHTETDVFDFASLDLEGDRRLVVTATYDGTTDSVTIRTVACYGDVLVAFSPEDGFVLTYSVC